MEVDGFEVVHEIKAGRLVKDSSTLRADPRKGLIRVVKVKVQKVATFRPVSASSLT